MDGRAYSSLLLWCLSSKCHQNTFNKKKISFPFNQLQMDAKIAFIILQNYILKGPKEAPFHHPQTNKHAIITLQNDGAGKQMFVR